MNTFSTVSLALIMSYEIEDNLFPVVLFLAAQLVATVFVASAKTRLELVWDS